MHRFRYGRRFFRQMEGESVEGVCAVVRELLDMAPITSVVDFGCGTGGWLAAFSANGVEKFLGLDGPWVPQEMLKIPTSHFRCQDLTKPSSLDERFDLAISLEVAEHLPKAWADRFVAMLVDSAPAVLFSAAVPGQGGVGHVNEQWPSYWADRFGAHGYQPIDALRPTFWNDDRIASFIRQNVLLYASEDLIARTPSLQKVRSRTDDSRLALIHPDEFAKVTDPKKMSLRRVLGDLPDVAVGTYRRHAGSRSLADAMNSAVIDGAADQR